MPHIIAANLIRIGHLLFCMFMLLAPFLATTPNTLLLHSQLVLFLLLKWIIKEWECGFTMLEYHLRGIKREEAFMYSILHPLVDIHEYSFNGLFIIVTIILGMISYFRYELALRSGQQ